MKVLVQALLVVATGVVSASAQGYGYQAPQPAVSAPQYASAPAQYNFQYDVNDQPSGNFFGHQEQRDGDRTEGSYYVQLPDSRLMRVEYYADQTGYHPTITFEGEAQFPSSAPSRGYSQPAPVPAPSRSYSQPAPAPAAPRPTYQQPAPAPSNLYSPPGK